LIFLLITFQFNAADERANRALADTASAVEQPHEEKEHSMKIKSMEEQVKQLQVQIQQQEAEAAAAMGQHIRQTSEQFECQFSVSFQFSQFPHQLPLCCR
jgi:hypothetical protein